jgi:predicted DNA-binding transcriptional regulator AlpA
MSSQPESQFLTREEAARELRVTLGTLDKFVKEGTLPKPGKLHNGRRVYFRRDDFFAALNVLLPHASVPVATPQPVSVVVPLGCAAHPSSAPRVRRAARPGSAAGRAKRRDAERLALLNSRG